VTAYVELLGRSCFSFLEGASHPEEMVETAQARGLEAIALCDRDGIYGMARGFAQGKKLGQRVIVGAELTVEDGGGAGSIALLAMDHQGYSNLCHLLTEAHADHDKGEAGITIAEIAASCGGLAAVVPLPGEAAWVDAVLGPAREAFADRLAIATWRHLDGGDRERTAAAIAASRRHDVPIVASARPLYHHPSRKPLSDVMHCIRHKTTLDEAGTALAANTEAYLRSGEQMLALFRDHPEWVH
jgi:error-prone DNA polymerase